MGDNGAICLYTSAAAHLIVDIGGYFPSDAGYWQIGPQRILDTRTGTDGRLPAGREITFNFGPSGTIAAVVLNVTVTDPATSGYVAVYPCNNDLPLASNPNFVPGQTVPNMVIAPVDSGGDVCFSTSADTHLLADINGVFFTD